MEAYVLIIAASITAISIAYQIAKNAKSDNITSFVIVDGVMGISYPVGVPNDIASGRNPANKDAVKVHLKLRSVKYVDFEPIKIIYSVIKWGQIIEKIVKNDETEIDYSNITSARLQNQVIFDCTIDYSNPIITEIIFDTDSKIKIKWKLSHF
jgi:hypothetical protein